MKVFIVGVDGYLGWSLAQYLATYGHRVSGMDNMVRRKTWVPEMGADSVVPIAGPYKRLFEFRKVFGESHFTTKDDVSIGSYYGNAANYPILKRAIENFEPDCIVNLAHMPSAPYSMIDHQHCLDTHINNMGTTLSVLWAIKELMPYVPLVTIGSAGEYGTPDVEIAEGYFEFEYKDRTTKMPFPRMMPASFYHSTKCHSSINIERACTWWDFSATDIMQSVVYGTRHECMSDNPALATRTDIDQCFGTVINRMVAQAIIGYPLTVYGKGLQKRGFLPLRDSMRCLRLLIENDPEPGEYRVVNQYDQIYSIAELAKAVKKVAKKFKLKAKIDHIDNPRAEAAEHYYVIEREKLVQLGYEPKGNLEEELHMMFEDMIPHKDRIEGMKDCIAPTITWQYGAGK
jgi:UDP-sulfoquinovose synthase